MSASCTALVSSGSSALTAASGSLRHGGLYKEASAFLRTADAHTLMFVRNMLIFLTGEDHAERAAGRTDHDPCTGLARGRAAVRQAAASPGHAGSGRPGAFATCAERC